MGSRVVIHCEPRIPWQPKRAAYFVEGFKRKGIPCQVTASRTRIDDCPAVLLGTTCWRAVEATGEYLLVDRCSFGDTDRFVSLVWNGHGRRGDHRVPENYDGERWERHGIPLHPWREVTGCVVMCGQTESYSPTYRRIEDWYYAWHMFATHFRPHPAMPDVRYANLPLAPDIVGATAMTLNSSIGVQCVLNGIPTITMDEGAMAWDVTGHAPGDIRLPDRREWCHWLAWTQFTDDEIREGLPWDWHL